MMVVISLIGLMAAISAPPLFRYIQSNRLQTSTDRLVADLQYARSVAISSGQDPALRRDRRPATP